MPGFYQASVIKKTLAFWGVFMTLYVLYKYAPVFPLALISGITESTFQHFKAGFYSYLIVNLVEYAVNRRRLADRQGFIYSRLAATVFLPWMIFLLWYLAPALIGRWPNIALEIGYANLITVLVGVCTVILEAGLEKGQYRLAQKTVLGALFLISILLYTVFTFELPWADVFVEPDWR